MKKQSPPTKNYSQIYSSISYPPRASNYLNPNNHYSFLETYPIISGLAMINPSIPPSSQSGSDITALRTYLNSLEKMLMKCSSTRKKDLCCWILDNSNFLPQEYSFMTTARRKDFFVGSAPSTIRF